MADFKELDSDIDDIASGVTFLATEIKALKDQVAAGSPVSQEQLDALDAKAEAIKTAIESAK